MNDIPEELPPPHSPAAEEGLMSCMLQDVEGVFGGVMDRIVDDELFYKPSLRLLFAVIKEISLFTDLKDIDIIEMMDYLEKTKRIAIIGGDEALRRLYTIVPTTASWERYFDRVAEDYAKRRLIRAATEIANKLYGDTPLDDAIGEMENHLGDAYKGRTGSEILTIRQVVPNVLERLYSENEDDYYIETGYGAMNELIQGFRPGYMYVIAARPSVGKSALAHNLAMHIGKNHEVGIISLEMDAESIASRLLAARSVAEVEYMTLEARRKRFQDIKYAADDLMKMKLFFEESASGNDIQLRQRCRKLKHQCDIKVCMIDYLQLFEGSVSKNETRERAVAKMSKTCKEMARELNIPVIVLAQLNRAMNPTDRPRLSNLRESGSIEQDADVVMLMHRTEDIQQVDVIQRIKSGGYINIEIGIAKNRNGRLGPVILPYYPKFTLFRDHPIDYRQGEYR